MAAIERISAVLVTGVVLLSALTGCTTPATSPSPAPVSSAAPSASPTATPLSPAEQDLKYAADAVVRLWATYDRIAADPQAMIGDMNAVASGKLLTTLQANLSRYRSYELTASGSTVVESPSARVSATNAQGLPTWAVSACIDSTNAKLVDKSGKSVIGPPYRVVHQSTVIVRDGRYLVAEDESTGTC